MERIEKEVTHVSRLARWQEYVGSATIVTALGFAIAGRHVSTEWWKALVMLAANLLAFAFSFMINDIEDAEDDARDPGKAQRNPVSARLLSKRRAYIYAAATGILSLMLFAAFGYYVFLIGLSVIILGFLYSWKAVRLKSLPLVDMVSHALFLGTLEFFAAAVIAIGSPRLILLVWGGFSLFVFSMIGDMKNELRDFDVDRKANLKNTAQLLNLKRYERYLTYLQFLPVAGCFVYLLFTLTLFKLLSFGIFTLLAALLYFVFIPHGKKTVLSVLYTEPFLAVIGILLLSHSLISIL